MSSEVFFLRCGDGSSATARGTVSGIDPERVARYLADLFATRGKEAFSHVKGRFVFALSSPQQLFAFRSQASPRPIYYTACGVSNRLATICAAENKRSFDVRYFTRFLLEAEALQHSSPLTPIEGVYRLSPGSGVFLEQGKAPSVFSFPKPDYEIKEFPGQDPEEVALRLQELLGSSIAESLAAKAPGQQVVCELSGGLDSSFVTAIVAKQCPSARAFMYAYPQRESHQFAETCARAVAQKCGIPLTVIDPTELPQVSLALDNPYRDEPESFSWQASLFGRAACETMGGPGLLFSGYGADQLFFPDPEILSWLLAHRRYGRVLSMIGDMARRMERSSVNLLFQALVSQSPTSAISRLFRSEEINLRSQSFEKVPWLNLDYRGHEARLLSSEKAVLASLPLSEIGAKASHQDQSYVFVPHGVMAPYFIPRGISYEMPFCDPCLIDYVFNEVSWDLIHDWSHPYKHLLRMAEKDWVPESLLTRRHDEFGFEGFLGEWLKTNAPFLRQLLAEGGPFEGTYSIPGALKAFEEALFGVISGSTERALTLLSYLKWWKAFQGEVNRRTETALEVANVS